MTSQSASLTLTPSAPSGAGIFSAPGLAFSALGVALVLALPVVVVIAHVFLPGQGAWAHLLATVLPEYVATTLVLLLGVSVGVAVIGVSTAWLVTAYRFPGQDWLQWVLILPLSMPAYVLAYAYTDALQFAGPVQTALREWTGWRAQEYWFPPVRSTGGAVIMFSLALYPYVYLLARAAFLDQSANLIEAGRLMGRTVWGTFFRVAAPLARPAIVAGVSLALMETLADFGTVSYFAVETFTVGIFRAWQSMGDKVAAAQLAVLLLMFVVVLVALEQQNRGRARFYNTVSRPDRAERLSGLPAAAAGLICLTPPVFGFLLPAGMLLHLTLTDPEPLFTARLIDLVGNSFILSSVTACIAVVVAVLLAYAVRMTGSRAVILAKRGAGLGYALPGAVIAVGVLMPVARLDNLIADWMAHYFGVKTGLILTGSIAALVYAYLVRFLAIALQTVDAGLAKIKPSMEDAARILGHTPSGTLWKVHVPMMWGSMLTAALLVFVDVMKELPATFAMRPFNFDTLAVQAYTMAKDERLPEAAAASLVIVAVALIPLLILSRQIAARRSG
ncbi:MAG: iron ABC transporter permease [Betaproteobacteria bacterium]|nr:iron ABC transporter permease [Betaproteobacteria bacterium]